MEVRPEMSNKPEQLSFLLTVVFRQALMGAAQQSIKFSTSWPEFISTMFSRVQMIPDAIGGRCKDVCYLRRVR